MDDLIKNLERNLFGENAKLTDIQHCFVKISYLDSRLANGKKFSSEQISKIVEGLIKQAKNLEAKIDKIMPAEDDPDYIKYRVIKAHTYQLRGFMFNEESSFVRYDLKLLEKALEILKPLKLTFEGFYYYYLTLKCFISIYTREEKPENHKIFKCLKEMEETFDAFKKKFPSDYDKKKYGHQALYETLEDMYKSFSQLEFCVNSEFFIFYNNFESNKEMKLKYAFSCIFALDLQKNGVPISVSELVPTINLIYNPLAFLISEAYFPQVNHLLSVIFFQLVKYRRTLPENEKQEINEAMGEISQLYADWAYEIVDYSLKWRHNKAEFENRHPINQNVIIFEKFVEPGVEAYANQFPCEPIVYREDIMKVVKKGKAWCQRAIDLYASDPEKVSAAQIQMLGYNHGLNTFHVLDLPERNS